MEVVNLKEVMAYLEKLPADTFDIAKTEIAASLFRADKKIKTNTQLKKRTGGLFKSIRTSVRGMDLDNLRASIFTDSVYAPPHEYSATIKAKNAYKGVPGGPYLNIPGPENLTAAGVMRKAAKQVFSEGAYIAGRTVRRISDNELMFYLVKQVKIPKRLNMTKYTEEQIPTMLSNITAKIGENNG